MKKVAVGLSGGVDSAVCALLLKRAGFDVVGVHLYCWPPKDEYLDGGSLIVDESQRERLRKEWIKKNGCRADEDRASALKTALEVGVPFKELDFSEEYNSRVIKYFYDEYEAGRTPNPDVLCNSEIKFGLFLEWALGNGFEAIATGHYAIATNFNSFSKSSFLATNNSSSPAELAYLHSRLENSADSGNQAFQDCESSQKDNFSNESIRLYIPKDRHKDQTYFLWKLTEKELKHVIFPLGDLLKSEVREIAKWAGLTVADKKDSQGICFVGNVEVRDFLRRRLLEKPGEVVDTSGKVIGTHKGIAFYTIGERGGWTMDSRAQKLQTSRSRDGDITKVYYVVNKNASANRLIVGDKNEVMSNKISIGNISLINHKKDEADAVLQKMVEKSELFVRIRHGGELLKIQKTLPAGSKVEKTKTQTKELFVETEKEVFGVASGQSTVFYSEAGECLGGGVIV